MAVMAREVWTDERLDDLTKRVDKGFEAVDRRFEAVDRRFEEVKGEIREVRGEVRELRTETNARFDSLQRTMIIGFAGIVASTVGSVIAAVLVA